MTREDLAAWLQVSATDQPPGLYVTRKPGVKPRDGKPGDAVCLICDGAYWYCLVNGEQQDGSGVTDPIDIPFVLWNGPFWAATEAEYLATMKAAKEAAIEEGKP